MKGKISISRFTGFTSGISIEVQDDSSRVQVFRVELTPEAYGNAVSGHSYQECEFELGRVDLVGMSVEHKIELVTIKGHSFTDEQKADAVAPFEIDGWIASKCDLGNHHKRVRDEGYNVTFHRHVKIQ
jgi:hypothetical protein